MFPLQRRPLTPLHTKITPQTTHPRRETGQGSGACRWLGRRETVNGRRDQDGGRRGLHKRALPHCRSAAGSACGHQVACAGHTHSHPKPHPATKPPSRRSTGKNKGDHAHTPTGAGRDCGLLRLAQGLSTPPSELPSGKLSADGTFLVLENRPTAMGQNIRSMIHLMCCKFFVRGGKSLLLCLWQDGAENGHLAPLNEDRGHAFIYCREVLKVQVLGLRVMVEAQARGLTYEGCECRIQISERKTREKTASVC